MKKIFTGIVALAALVSSGSSWAADEVAKLAEISSPVMINQGDRYVPATAGMALKEGDQLMVLQGGKALVNYATGCEIRLGGNEILRIAATDACSAPAVAAVNAQLAPSATTSPAVVSSTTAAGWTAAQIAAFVAAGGIIVAAVDASSGSDDAPPPPISG